MSAIKIDSAAIPLLVNYGLGCVNDLVREGFITPERAKSLVNRAFADEPLTLADARSFRNAYVKCTILASKMGKGSIDTEVVRTYFLDPSQHNSYVDRLWEATKDFDREGCKSGIGTIRKLDERSVVVAIDFGGGPRLRTYASHMKGLRMGDDVAVHAGYVAEGMSKELADLVSRLKSADSAQRDLLLGVFKSKDGKEKKRIRS